MKRSHEECDYTNEPGSLESLQASCYSDDSDESSIEEETIPTKEQAMRKIEFALADIQNQIDKNEKVLVLRTSYNKSDFSIRYSRNRKEKLDRDLHCLHQVYDLLENDKRSTKRELFYEHKPIYVVQRILDSSIKTICELLNETRTNLNILSCGRGILRGPITFLVRDVGVIDARVQDVLVTDALLFSELISEAEFILVVEKDTTFQKLIDEKFQLTFPRGVLVTSKGYPDIATRNVLKMLAEKRKWPIFGLFDADPHGIEIYLTYKYGASKESAEGRNAFVPTMKWIGLFPTDYKRFTIHEEQCLPLLRCLTSINMAETTTEVPPTSTNATVFTFEEQATSSLALYGMSILCIIIGSIRSAQYIKKNIEKKRLIEGSITMKEARKFPISASLVLFGLYIFFKPAAERFLWVARVAQTLRVPEQYVEKINSTIISYTSNSEVSTEPTEPFLMRLVSRIPRDRVPEQIQAAAIYVYSQLPTIEKTKCMELLTLLICFEGISAFASLLQPIITSLLKKIPLAPSYLQFNAPYLLSLKKGNKEMEEGDIEEAKKKETEYLVKIDFDRHYIIALLLCSPILISHLNKRHWITNNIIGISFSILGIERLHLASFKAGSLLLIGLFFYDIFWVFGTDVMTSVAKGIDAPILLQFPQDIYRNGVWEANKHSMLGLGDIVIPGIFIALLRRFDYRIGQATKEKSPLKGRYYFAVTVIAYMAGLFITMAVMHHFKAAQPALLYLVPCCLFVPLILAIVRGELSEIWNYDEGKHVDNEENRKRVDSSKKNN